jgi:gliding motility-associated-like protein
MLIVQPNNICDESDNDGFTIFNLNDLRTQIELDVPATANIFFYQNIDDAINSLNPIDGEYRNTVAHSETLYVKVLDNNQCYALTTAELNVLYSPELLSNESLFYCLNTFPELITLDAGILNDSFNNTIYQWFLDGILLSNNSSSIDVNSAGNYTVIATFRNNCSSSREITVLPSNLATFESIQVQEVSINNSITVNVSGEGTYEYSLDHGLYQDNNMFSNVMAGFRTVYVRDKNDCGVVEQMVSVLGFPKFFTPNGDSYQDTWNPLGANSQINSNLIVNIYDRFGKLLKEIKSSGDGWNGTFNGDLLPSDDYWFVILFPDGKEYRGHFSLKR